MPRQVRSSPSENSEEARAFLQSRVALFWKVMFFISLLSVGLGVAGVIVEPGVDHLLNIVGTVQAGLFWWLCRRGARSIRFSRAMEAGGLLFNMSLGAFIGRYLLGQFIRDYSLVSSEGVGMADGFVSMMLLGGITMLVAIRAALIPSLPRRTGILTAILGVPVLIVSTVVVPTPDGGLAWRALDSAAYPWLPITSLVMWGFAIITCTVISWVIYGLRAEVREARHLGQYVVEQKLGEGGMGEVYRARHGMMRRPSAIKLIRADRAGEMNLHRFEREVQLTARLTHPNTITIYDYGRTDDDIFYYAMELLDGATLQRIVEVDGAQPAGRVVRVLAMACGALAEAHATGLIHRDIKPANIMLCKQGGELDVVKVLDFGLVKELEVDEDVALTAANTITGTPQYLAPEAIRASEAIDARTDIYALGAVAYFLLAGTEVFDGKSVVEICGQHLHEEPEPLSARGVAVPADLEEVVLACLAKDPEQRPQSAVELRRRVEACAVEAWDDARARAWWREYRPLLEGAGQMIPAESKTIAVDGAHRSSTELTGPT